MGNYVRDFTETFDFDGDSITVTLKQLKRIDAMELLPAMAGMVGIDPDKPETLTQDRIAKGNAFVETAAKIIKEGEYIVQLAGMTMEGRPVAAGSEELGFVLSDFYFTGFVSTVAGLLIKHSSISKAVEKKLDVQSGITEVESAEDEVRL